MAEVKDPIVQEPAAMQPEQESAPQQAAPQQAEPSKKKSPMSKKKKGKIVRRVVALVVLAAIALALLKHFKGGGSGGSTEVVTDTVDYGAITATVEGNGMVKAKNSESISLNTTGTVQEVLVAEGDEVTAGTPLFVIDSPAAQAAVQKARSTVEGYQKQLSAMQKDIAGLNLAAPYPGKLMETVKLNPGDSISKGTVVAKINDDTKLRLKQYYSYAYAGELKAGQSVEVSIPSLMTSVSGTIEAVHMVTRITPEGSKLFSADVVIPNAGVLTADMTASACVTVNGETVYPYEAGKLEYYRTGELTSTVNGTVISSSLVDYLQVSAGQVLVRIDGEDSEGELFSIQQSLESAQEDLDKAEKNLANCNAVAPIDGTVIGLSISVGDEVNTQNPLATISDTKTVLINATVDERNISYVKPGLMVNLDQWGTSAVGTVESVSLSSSVNNGVATYPVVISADNSDGSLQINSNINYNMVASQNDNCLVVPLQAVRTAYSDEDGESLSVVYVKGDKPENVLENVTVDEDIPSGFWPVQVETGISDNYNVEIKSGLEQGQEIFTQILTESAWG